MIRVNGNVSQVSPGQPVSTVLAELKLSADLRGIAVAVNGEVIPRSDWDTYTLSDSARVEVLGAMQGG